MSGKLGGQSTVPASPRWPKKDLMMKDIRMPVHLISSRLLSTYYKLDPVIRSRAYNGKQNIYDPHPHRVIDLIASSFSSSVVHFPLKK